MKEDENEIILITRFEWNQVQAKFTACNTRLRWLAEQMASMQAALLYPGNLEARVAYSRTKYRELLELLGYSSTEELEDADGEDDQQEAH
jgi:multidrug resistance efflux pump